MGDDDRALAADPHYQEAELRARDLGMPISSTWAYLWPETTVSAVGPTQFYLKLRGFPGQTIGFKLPYRDVRALDGFVIKMLGMVTDRDSPTTWAIANPHQPGAYLLVELWLSLVPIGAWAMAVRQRWPDGVLRKRVNILDDSYDPDGDLIAKALRALDMRVNTGGQPRLEMSAEGRVNLEAARQVEAYHQQHKDDGLTITAAAAIYGFKGDSELRKLRYYRRRLREMQKSGEELSP